MNQIQPRMQKKRQMPRHDGASIWTLFWLLFLRKKSDIIIEGEAK